MRENKQEFPCQITNMSAGGIAVHSHEICEIGERIIIYAESVGRIEGKLTRKFQGGFALKISASAYKQEKTVNQLTWLINKDKLKTLEDRQHNRFVPKKLTAKITTSDGIIHECRIVDMSLGGAAAMLEPLPGVGETVMLGLISGRVIRHTDHIINIRFDKIQDPATLERQFN